MNKCESWTEAKPENKRTDCSFSSTCKLFFSGWRTYPWCSCCPRSIPLQPGVPHGSGCPGVLPAAPWTESPSGWLRARSSLGRTLFPTVALTSNDSPLDENIPAGWISNLADPKEDCNGWTVLPECFLYLWVPLRGGFILEKGLTRILYNVFLFPFPPFSSFTKC